MRCDLHVHSYFSGPTTTPFARNFCRESYSNPHDVYSLLHRRGMNLFTLTDHDSIEGTEQLRQHPDFFVSEELTCKMPSGTEVHIGVYDITDRQHLQLQQRRNDLVSLLMYLTERRLFFSINHVFSAVTGRREREDFAWFQEYFPAVETRNSHMLESANQRAAQLAKQWDKIAIGGSDAHALPSAGTAYTEVPGARDKEEFFAGPARRHGPRCRRIRQLQQTHPRCFLDCLRNDARKILDHFALAASRAHPGDYLLELSRRTCFRQTLGRGNSRRSRNAQTSSLDIAAAICGGGIRMTVAKAVWNQIQSNDYRLMRRVHRWRAPRWFRILMILMTRMGDGWLWYSLGLILLVYGGEHRFLAIGAATAAAFVGILLFRALKKTSKRQRPCEIEPHCWSLILPPDKYSFPSGHTITAFAIALSLGLFYPQLQGVLLAVALLIASSRIILGMHFLSDVLAGSAIGIALGTISYHIFATL